MPKIPDGWVFLRDMSYTVQGVGTTRIFLYRVGEIFGGCLPMNMFMITASTESEVINECKAECDRYLKEDDNIPF